MLRRITLILLKAFLYVFIFTIVWALTYRFVPVPVTFLMLQRCAEQKLNGKELKLQKQWMPLEKISPHLQMAVVASEDQNFLNHHGFDLEAIQKAMKHNEKQKKRQRPRIRGASTISQQCAKNVFLWHGRNFVRKGLEVYFTFLIELLWSKERIMEVYLNVAETGDGVYGAEAASNLYFHRRAAELSREQAALLAVCLPNPRKFKPTSPTPYLQRRQSFILQQMNQLGGTLDYDEKKRP